MMKNNLCLCAQRLRSKVNALRVLALMISAAFCFPSCDEKKRAPAEVASEMEAMGTVVLITAYASSAAEGESAVQLAQAEVSRLEKLWSATDPESEISALNAAEGPITVSDETALLLRFAKEMAIDTEGAFDPTVYPLVNAWGFLTHRYRVPSDEEIQSLLPLVGNGKMIIEENTARLEGGAQIDLGGIGKGAAGDFVARVLRQNGVNSAIINLGGNVHLIGARPDGQPWRIGIRGPYGKGILGLVAVQNRAVVTSGMYERNFTDNEGNLYHHILDPATGRPAENGLVSVTILAREGMRADALSTGLFVMGTEKAIALWRERGGAQDGGFGVILATSENEVLISEGVARVFTPEHEYEDKVRVIIKDSEYMPLLPEFLGAGVQE